MTLRTRAAALGLSLGLSLVLALTTAPALVPTAAAAPARVPTAGSAGLGDPYFPLDGNGGIDVQHYDLRVHYVLDAETLHGRAGLDVVATQELSSFNLDFLLPVRSVRVDGQRAAFHRRGDHELRITPRTPLAAGSTFRVVVRYAGKPARQSSYGELDWIAVNDEAVAIGEPHIAAWWFPANDHPRDKATYDIRVVAPHGLTGVANGVLASSRRHGTGRVFHWRSAEPMASYLAFFALGRFRTRASTCRGIPNYVAVSRLRATGIRNPSPARVARRTCKVVSAYSDALGPYPFAATGALVTGLPFTFALENQTRPTYPAHYRVTPELIAHEIAHQWFGDSVSVDSWRDVWLNEGFAQFMQTWYSTEVTGGGSVQDWLEESYRGVLRDRDFWRLPIDDPGADHLFDGAVYLRGSMALQALRHRVGDPAFWATLRTWLDQRRYGHGTVGEFEALAAQVSGQELTAFFDAWLHQPVAPARTPENGF